MSEEMSEDGEPEIKANEKDAVDLLEDWLSSEDTA